MQPVLTDPEETRVLHIDDDPGFLDLAETLLERERSELTVTTETDAARGLGFLADNRVDCIVSDYNMPQMDGLEVLSRVRESDGTVPFILFTGRGSEEIAAEAIEAGVDSYLRKESGQAQFTVLANRIESLVNRAWTSRRARKMKQTYELIAKTATDAFWIRDIETGETYYSDGISRFGYEPGVREDGFEWWAERVHPDDRDESRDLNELQRQGEPAGFDYVEGELGEFTHEYRWRCADDSYVQCLSRGIVRFEDGDPVEMVGAMKEQDGSFDGPL